MIKTYSFAADLPICSKGSGIKFTLPLKFRIKDKNGEKGSQFIR
jgi:hypothetical protein